LPQALPPSPLRLQVNYRLIDRALAKQLSADKTGRDNDIALGIVGAKCAACPPAAAVPACLHGPRAPRPCLSNRLLLIG
jgi:hypothetical protein